MPIDDTGPSPPTEQSKASHLAYKQEDEYVVIDTLKVPLRRPGSTRREGATSDSVDPRQPKDITHQYPQSLGALSNTPAANGTRAPEQADPTLALGQDHPDIQPFDRPIPRSQPCNECLRFSRYCDRQLPTCGACSEIAAAQCRWTSFKETMEPATGHHDPPFALSCDDDLSFDLGPSTPCDADLLENFDFDAFLGDENHSSIAAGNDLDGEEHDYWRSTIAAAEPMADVERPRPRPR